MAKYFYYWTKNTAVLKIYMGFDGRDTPILTFSKSKKYLKIFSPSFNIAIKQNIISWDIYRSVSPMQKHVNCGAFGSVDKITCHIYKTNCMMTWPFKFRYFSSKYIRLKDTYSKTSWNIVTNDLSIYRVNKHNTLYTSFDVHPA